jgi:hypothetical protein
VNGRTTQQTLFHTVSIAPGRGDSGAPCMDCGVDTFEIDESYMVSDEVWLAACPWNTAGAMFDFLCVGCLEGRIGRRLEPGDFPDYPINHGRHYENGSPYARSERLRARLAGDAAM